MGLGGCNSGFLPLALLLFDSITGCSLIATVTTSHSIDLFILTHHHSLSPPEFFFLDILPKYGHPTLPGSPSMETFPLPFHICLPVTSPQRHRFNAKSYLLAFFLYSDTLCLWNGDFGSDYWLAKMHSCSWYFFLLSP